jgi:glycosyltransferase involved in cell wall biosynthesis
VTAGRLLLITGLWPTADMPSAGVFVRERVGGDPRITVIGPHRYDTPTWWRYLRLLWAALTSRGTFVGVEAHVLFPTGVIGLLAARIRRVPLVVYVHGDEVRNAAFRTPLHTWLSRLVARTAAVVIANSADTAAHARRLGCEPVVIPPGIDLARFRPTPRPTDRRVLYLGGDRLHKGYDVARDLADTVVGPGLTEIPPDDVPSLMAAHDVLLMPSREEGFGVAAVEAMASGRWVVAAAVGGLPEVITHGLNGSLVFDGNFRSALAAVPDYDAEAVAASAGRFSVDEWRCAMKEVWDRVRG